MSKSLPPGWDQASLGDLRLPKGGRANVGGRPNQIFELWSVPSYATGKPEVLPGRDIGSEKQVVVPGTVLVCRINPRINRIWVVGARGAHEQIASTEWVPFFPLDGLMPSFLRYYMQQQSFREYLASNVSGVGGSLMRVRPEVVDKFPAILPPTPEQHRIVAAIEERFSELDAAVAALERVRASLPRYRAAVLKVAGEGRLVETSAPLAEWREVTIGDVATEVRYGTSAKTSENGDGVPVLRMGNIVDGALDLQALKFLPGDHDEFPNLLLKPGDVLFNRTNSAELVGKSAVYHGTPTPCSFASYLIRIRLASTCVPAFLNYCLNSTMGRAWIRSVVSQQVGQANVSGGKLKAFRFRLPPASDQQCIVAEVDRRLSLAAAAERAVETGLAKAQRLRQAILKRAFEGKLVPQDPTDEPATVLLERLRAGRAAGTSAAATRRAKRLKPAQKRGLTR